MSAGLDTSVGVSGRRDFTVRTLTRFVKRGLRPSHPALNVRDDREAPLFRVRDGASHAADLPDRTSAKYFATDLDNPNQLERAGEFGFYAQAIFYAPTVSRAISVARMERSAMRDSSPRISLRSIRATI